MVRMNRFSRRAFGNAFPVKPGKLSPTLTVPANIPRPPYALDGVVPPSPYFITVHDEDMIARMRVACKLARQVLDLACASAKVGMTTDEIDKIVHSAICAQEAYPSPLNYGGFPKSVCSSVNEVICHGIPDDREMQDGDIVSFDVSCFTGGVHGDNCGTVALGEVDSAGRRLIQAAQEALDAGVAACGPGRDLKNVGAAIHKVCDDYGYDTVRKYCGHGVCDHFHAPPYVQHFRNDNSVILQPGMIFTIEPMVTEGNQSSITWSDNWTAATADGARAAQFEHTVLITETGVEILTLP
jgi:methionyl aminopeptidase